MLVTELATSKGVAEGDAAGVLGKALAKANLKFPEPL
jgi:hypothetical protein